MKIKICKSSQLKNNETFKFTVPHPHFDRDAFVLKQSDRFFGYFNECPHIGIELDWNDNDFLSADFSKLVCKNHGAEFNPHDGECTVGPCQGIPLKKIEILIEDDELIANIP